MFFNNIEVIVLWTEDNNFSEVEYCAQPKGRIGLELSWIDVSRNESSLIEISKTWPELTFLDLTWPDLTNLDLAWVDLT